MTRRLPSDLQPTPVAFEAWALIVASLEGELPASSIEHWLLPGEAAGIDRGSLAIAVPTRCLDWWERRYAPRVGHLVRELTDLNGLRLYELPDPATSEVVW